MTAFVMMVAPTTLAAQDFLFGQSPSGSAGGVVNTNAQGLGFSARAGHVAGFDVGRRESLSTFQLSPYVNIGDGLFFGDARMNYANNGELAYSTGAGYRHYITAWDAILGGYGYYDWDRITGAKFKQWSYGVELLSQRWEARGNYYRPYGDTSTQTGSRVAPGSQVFVGNTIEFSRINTFAEALRGFDAEVGFLLPGDLSERFDIRAFGGGYAYKGVGQPEFAGFSTRLQADIGNWLELGLKLTDDNTLHTNVSFSAIVHFGGYSSQEHTSRSAMQRMAEPVRRNMNIAAATTDVTVGGLQALGTNGLPLNIVHVSSAVAPGGTGTVENPFNQLSTGLGVANSDIVFVHAGSVFSAPPDNIVSLANDQSLFGEGLIRATTAGGGFISDRKVINTIELAEIGELVLPDSPTFAANLASLGPDPFGPLPAMTPIDPVLLRPTLTGALGDAVTLGDNSRIGGFIIDAPTGHGVLIDGVTGTNIRDTFISNAGGDGILIQNTAANTTTTILDTIIANATGAAFHINGGAGNVGFNSTSLDLDPSFGSITNASQEAVLIENRTGGSVNMFGATIDDVGGTGIVIRDSISNVTIDNASIDASTSTGISITNSEGNFAFRNSIRAATAINMATGDSLVIDGLAAGSNVTFEDLSITNPLAGGINIDNLAGNFVFTRDLSIGAPGATAVAAPAISVANSLSTGQVRFGGDVTVQGSTGRGLELASNAVGSSFSVAGALSITSAIAESVVIENNAGTVQMFGGTIISQRGAEGISITNSTGAIAFEGGTTVLNENLAANTAVQVLNTESLVLFENLTVTNALTGGGVNLQNNLVGATGPGTLVFNNIDVTSIGGVGFQANNNTSIRIDNGNITSTGAAAVDIANSGINVTLESVNSAASPDFGISLVETNVDGLKTFTVTGDITLLQPFGTGGVISNAATAGVNMQNAGQVTLQGMLIDDNNYGLFVRNSGIATDEDQFLDLQFVQVQDSDVRGLDAENLFTLNIEDSIFSGNGDTVLVNAAPDGTFTGTERETIFLNYTEAFNDVDTTLFAQFTEPYFVNIERSSFIDGSDDTIRIVNSALATGAHIDVNLANNDFTMDDTLDFLTDVNETAFLFDWNGVARVNLFSNIVNMNGQTLGETQTAFDIRNSSFTDELILDVVSNTIPVSVQPGAIGLAVSTNAVASTLVDNNNFTFSGVDSTGFLFDLGPNNEAAIINNTLTFLNDEGTGMLFSMVNQSSVFTISNNFIGLTDLNQTTQEIGIQFRTVVGTPQLQGNLDNQIVLLNPGFIGGAGGFLGVPTNINIDFAIPRANGQILINGALRP